MRWLQTKDRAFLAATFFVGIPTAPIWVAALTVVRLRDILAWRLHRCVLTVEEHEGAFVLTMTDGSRVELRPSEVARATSYYWGSTTNGELYATTLTVSEYGRFRDDSAGAKLVPIERALLERGTLKRDVRERFHPTYSRWGLEVAFLFASLLLYGSALLLRHLVLRPG